MSQNWKWYLPGYIVAAPFTLAGLLLALFFYWPETIRLHDGCIEMTMRPSRNLIGGKWVGGQTFGNVIFYRSKERMNDAAMRVHERCHVAQTMLLGPLMLVIYVGHFLYRLVRYRKGWLFAYRDIIFETLAYQIAEVFSHDTTQDMWGRD